MTFYSKKKKGEQTDFFVERSDLERSDNGTN